jgi:hypothetical protein
MAAEKEYQLWVLMKATGADRSIKGIRLIGATQGSVVLDVLVKYSDLLHPQEAFTLFKRALEVPFSTSRVQNLSQIRQAETLVIFQGHSYNHRQNLLGFLKITQFWATSPPNQC